MDTRSPLNQCIALVLIGILFLDPIVATAAQLAVDQAAGGNTQLGQAGNGVPVVNIATPDGSGLSHNRFREYNVGQQGLILNNATDRTQATQLGGLILGNPNLQGRAAATILNEVTGGNRSLLGGYTEVAGQSARVIVSNPHGLTCNGCGFINTPRATLTTGKPVLDAGRLARFQVDGGDIAIEGTGLNASNVDQFELITRSARINAELHAQRLDIITGRNDVQADSLAATPRAADGSPAPALAIDSSALGGMYAGAIRLLGTEAGVGVRLAGDLAASAGDIRIDANGQVTLAQTAAAGNLQVKAQGAELTAKAYAGGSAVLETREDLAIRQSLAAKDAVHLNSGGRTVNQGVVEAGVNPDNSRNDRGDVQVRARDVRNAGSLVASRDLEVSAHQTLDNRNGTLSTQGQARVSAGKLDNRQGRVLAQGDLALSAGELDNQAGLVNGASQVQAQVGHLDNRGGEVSSRSSARLQVGSVDNRGGKVIAEQALDLTASGAVNNQGGTLGANQQVKVQAATLDNSRQGRISSQGGLDAKVAGQLDNSDAGRLSAAGPLTLEAGEVRNDAGTISSQSHLQAQVGSLQQVGGELVALGWLELRGERLANRDGGLVGAGQGLRLVVGELDNRGGEISSRADASLSGGRLDNSGGQLLVTGSLLLTIDQLINQAKGLVSADGSLRLTGRELSNAGGTLASGQDLRLDLREGLANQQGRVTSEGALGISAATLDNTGGHLSAAGPLSLETLGAVLNRGGQVLSDAGLELRSGRLDNRQGLLSAQGAIHLSTGAFDNRNGGRLLGGDRLFLDAGRIDNSDQGRIGSAKALDARATQLDQHDGGQLFSQAELRLDLQGGGLDNRGGLLHAPGQLLLLRLGDVSNQGGEISSQQAVTLAARSLDNAGGQLLSAQALALRIERTLANLKGLIAGAALDVRAAALDNRGGTLSSRSNTGVTVGGALDNREQGLINASERLTLEVASLDNQGGSLLAGTALALHAQSVDNRHQGLINSQGHLSLQADSLDSSQGGEVSAQGDLALRVRQLIQRQGRLIGARGLTLDLQGGDLDNQGGLILANGPLRLEQLRDLANQGGEISSRENFALDLRHLDNRGGKLISQGRLGLALASANNQGGLLSGWLGLELLGQSLDNSGGGTLSSRSGDLGVRLTGALLNRSAGALVSQGGLSVQAASLDNSGQGILSSGAGQTLEVTDLLDNRDGGLIDSGAGLNLKAGGLDNAAGTLQAHHALMLQASDLNNSGGRIAGNGAVTLNLLGALTNIRGTLASAGPLLLQWASSVDNRGGQIASQGLLTLLTGTLDNRDQGTLAANDALRLSASGGVQNGNDGLIFSRQAGLSLQAASLDNAGGTLQSQGDLAVSVAGAVSNLGGRLISREGNVDLEAATLDNRDGVLASLRGWVKAHLGDWLDNSALSGEGGVIQAQFLNLAAINVNNQGGHISALGGDARLATGQLDNRRGGLFAQHLLQVTGTQLINGGQVAAGAVDFSLAGALDNQQGIIESDSILALAAAALDNRGGQLRALGGSGRTQLSIQGLFDNRGGALESANHELGVIAGNFLNAGGKVLHVGRGAFDIDALSVTDGDGSLVTRGVLTLTADSWTNSSVLQAGSLIVRVGQFTQTASGQLLASELFSGSGGTWTNHGLLASDGDFRLDLSGTYSGSGRISSLGRLSLSASQLSLPSEGRITGGDHTDIQVGGLLTTSGRITAAGNLTVNAGAISNFGTLGSAGQLRLVAPSLHNEHGLIFSGGDMTLRVASFTNRFADVYSLGALDIAADDVGSRGALLENISATLESAGDMSLAAASIVNRKDVFGVSEQLQSGTIKFRCIDCSDSKYQRVYYYVDERIERTVTADSATALIASGGNLGVTSDSFHNQHSLVSAAGNIEISSVTFLNEGATTESVVRSRTFLSPKEGADVFSTLVHGELATYNKHNSLFVHRYGYWQRPTENIGQSYFYYGPEKQITDQPNPDFNPSVDYGVPAQILGYSLVSSAETSTTIGVAANAIIQAGGNVTIQATSSLGNGVSHDNVAYAGGTNRVSNTAVDATTGGTVAQINAQLPPDLAQQQVNPLTLPGFSLPTGDNGLFRLSGQDGSDTRAASGQSPQQWTLGGASVGLEQRERWVPGAPNRPWHADDPGRSQADAPVPVVGVQGLPERPSPSRPHAYLIETNPTLTDLKQFLSSDYLLGNLGYDPDQAQKRLGDGLYEQRLVREAIAARTGQRFLDGLASDEAMFRYLMDNAIASKQQLGLSVGVGLSAAQVAALTHDIVWMEEHEVNGEKVLVPVLYLAQADGRLAPNGALIQGKDVTLISGGELANQGTLRASDNLSATGKNLVNSGLIEAGNRLDLLATDSIRNAQGGIIAGRDVSAIALTGDILNERSSTTVQVDGGGRTEQRDYLDSAARIEAANSLSLSAGRDIANIGSVLQAGGDLFLSAGRDVQIRSQEERSGQAFGAGYRQESMTQHGSTLTSGRDLSIEAGRDITAIASQLEAKRDIQLEADRDILLAAAANEEHFYSKSKKVTRQEDHVRQQETSLVAGGDVDLQAGKDLTLVASRIEAGDEAYLYAGNDLSLLAAEDSDYSLYEKKKKGSFGSNSFKRDEVTDVRNIGSSITTGGDLTLVSEGDQRYQKAKLESGADLTLDSGGEIAFEAVKDLHQESHEKSKGDLAWTSAKGKGTTDETVRQSELVAQGEIAIQAVDGLKFDLKHLDQQTVSQTIDAMVQADPSLAWIKELEQRGDVDWRRVKEIHDSFKYSHSGLGVGAQLVVAIVVTYLTWGAGTSLSGAAAGSLEAGIANSVVNSVAVNTAVSTINNKGNLGEVAKDITSSDSLKNYAAAGVSGGVAGGGIGLEIAVNSALKTVVSGGKFKDNLAQAAIDLAANALTAAIYQKVGDSLVVTGLSTKVAVHAIVGGLIAEAAGGDFRTGALAAGANEALVDTFGKDLFPGEAHERVLAMTSQLIGITVAAAAGGDEKAQEKAGWVAQQATLYNHELHRKNAESFAQGVQMACVQRPGLCAPGAEGISQGDLVHALEVTAAHGEGIETVNPKALALVNQFLNGFSGTKETLFSPTDSELDRLDVLEKAEFAGAVAGLASAAKSVLKSSGGLLEALKGIFGSGGAKGTANFPEGMSFNPNIKNHLRNFDGLTQKNGIGGTHNLDVFKQAVTANGVKMLSETPTSVAGISTVRYQIPAYDRAGNVVGFKDKVFPKTVYDPRIFTDQKILDLGQQAAASGYKDALSKGQSQYDSTVGGVTFRVYLDKATGTVTNFHPK